MLVVEADIGDSHRPETDFQFSAKIVDYPADAHSLFGGLAQRGKACRTSTKASHDSILISRAPAEHERIEGNDDSGSTSGLSPAHHLSATDTGLLRRAR